LVIHINDEKAEFENILKHFANIYRRLGQLVVLEDLAVDCNMVRTESDPWSPSSDRDHKETVQDIDKDWTVDDQEPRRDYLVCLDFSLRQGLGYMDKLKRLRRLNVRQVKSHEVGEKECE